MLISVKPCENCGNDKVKDYAQYDGCLGYEAIICKKCGYLYDHTGSHKPDEFSLSFVKGGEDENDIN